MGRSLQRWRGGGLAALGLAAVGVLLPATHLVAEDTPPASASPPIAAPPAATPPASTPQDRLRNVQQDIDQSEARRRALANDIATFKTDRARFEQRLIDIAATTSADEDRIATAEQRLASLQATERASKQALDSRRAIVAQVLAVLQRMGHKPPPALLVAPEDVLRAIRTSMLLGAVVPGMRSEIEKATEALTTLQHSRQAIEAERATLSAALEKMRGEKIQLAALIDARQLALGKAQSDVVAEREKARQLAQEAGSLKELISRTERESGAASQAAEAAQKSDERLAGLMGAGSNAPGATKDPARLAPAVSFASMRGGLSWPVSGAILKRFGEDDGLGSSEKGMLFSTRRGALVTAPADGWVAFAGPYRSFGQLLILNVGGGYYIVLAGLDRVNVSLGQFVLAGEPVAAMGDGTAKTAAALALAATEPTLYVEFRKDGATIDPGPWWAKPELQKVRG